MLPDPVREIAAEIGSDTSSGALPLALRAIEAYSGLRGGDNIGAAAEALHRLMRRGQPWMAAVVNASAMACELARAEDWGKLAALGDRLRRARTAVAQASPTVLRRVKTVLTLSYSSDVFEALKGLREQSPALTVYVGESRPLGEGVALTKDLRAVGVEAFVIVDAAGPSLVPQCDAVVTGADSLLRSGQLVNKIGTLALALACEDSGVPFYPLLEVIKVELEGQELPWREESRDPGEVSGEVEALNFYFERVPGRLVASAVTDAGVLEVDQALDRFRRKRDLGSFYLPE